MVHRLAWAYGGTAVGLLLLVPVAAVDPEAAYYAPPIILPALGLLAGLAWSDTRRALAPRDILVRASAALAGYFASIVPVIVAYELHDLVPRWYRLWLESAFGLPMAMTDWLPFAILAVTGPPTAVWASAAVSWRASRWSSWVVEIVTCLLGAYVALLLTRQLLWAFSVVALGPLSTAEAFVWHVVSRLEFLGHMSHQELSVLAFAAPLGGAFLALRIRRQFGNRGAALLVEAAAGLALLAVSYRLASLLGLAAIVAVPMVVRSNTTASRFRAVAWPFVLLLCLAPVDVSLQAYPSRAHWAPTISGLLAGSAFEKAEQGELVVVGGCSGAPHYPPRWVWVW